jgi:hypothetical protein
MYHVCEIAPSNAPRVCSSHVAESHPLTNTFPMMNPFDVLLVCIAYLVAVFVGRIIMSP